MADYQRLITVQPGSPVFGAVYIDATLGLGWYDGSEWVYAGGGGGGGTVDSVVAGTDINVDDTDPANPVVSFDGTIPTTVEQLTLGGEAVAGAVPTSGSGPWILKSDGSSWSVEALPSVPSEIDGNLTLGGKTVAATPPTSGGPYFLEYDGTEWIAEAITAHVFKAHTSAAVSMPSNDDYSLSKVSSVNTSEIDTDGAYDTSTSRYTAVVAGYWLVTVVCVMTSANAASASGDFADLAVAFNGTPEIGGLTGTGVGSREGFTATEFGAQFVSSTIVQMNGSTDYVEVFSNNHKGSNTARYAIMGHLIR